MNPTQRLRPFLYGGHGGDLVEDMRSYKPGGFHPVHLGDTFSLCPGSDRPRYRILQKLGQGAFSTVWLAQDMADHEYVVFLKHLFGTDHWQPLLAAASLSKSPPRTSRTMRLPFSRHSHPETNRIVAKNMFCSSLITFRYMGPMEFTTS